MPLTAPAHAAFPGANGKIVLAKGDGLYSVNPDSSELRRLTDGTYPDSFPSWSADGRKIAFTRDGFARGVWIMNPDGSGQRQIPLGSHYVDPAWSPDSQKVAVRGIAVIDVNSGHDTTISNTDFDPAWSPDGTKIAFVCEFCPRPDLGDIWTMNPDGTGRVRVTQRDQNNSGDIRSQPDWSPDGSKLVFTTGKYGGIDIAVINADGTGETRLTSTPDAEVQPAWSPDGRQIVFVSKSLGGVSVMNADGTGQHFVTVGGETTDPDWQPIPYSYPRPKGASPFRASLVVAYKPCSTPNETHGPPLAYGSCSPPVQASEHLTVGTPPQDPASSIGNLRASVVAGDPQTAANEADLSLAISVTDVRAQSSLADYIGELRADLPLRITDRDNPLSPGDPNRAGTVSDHRFPATVPCAATADTTIGATCALTTTANSVLPGAVKEASRAIWELGQTAVWDGGPDGDAETEPNTLFMVEGVFVP